MRKLAISAALATTILATPAVARDGAWYAGIEGGILLAEDTEYDYRDATVDVVEGIVVDHNKRGWDIDLIGGYDFGSFRLEAESGFKRATIDHVVVAPATDIGVSGNVDTPGSVRVWSAMANALIDIGDENAFSGYAGVGAGVASLRHRFLGISDEDSSFAWQVIGGIRTAISPNLDVGFKYRFFNMRNVRLENNDAVVPWVLEGDKFRSHSLLASLTYNFVAPVAPPPPVVEAPPPPPPPPATQTCPDGSVILATETCPVPPPPPPAPPGERG